MSILNKKIDKRSSGKKAEEQACVYLQEQGLALLRKNFSCPLGEIDLIMTQKQSLIFIEVRYRHRLQFGHPVESVSSYKQQRLIRTAFYFLRQQREMMSSYQCRFDIVGMDGLSTETSNIKWIQNAFGLEGNGYEYF